jgi:hypothetical protein
MPKLIEFFEEGTVKTNWRTQYIRYRLGRLKHQYWLWNRKHKYKALIDEYDHAILLNCKPGTTVFFASAGYYLKDIFPEIEVIEMHPVVKTFYPDVHICTDRNKLTELQIRADNFVVTNNRGDHWVTVDGLNQHLKAYTKIMNPGCRFMYSFRDTQIHVNRLITNLEDHFLQWAKKLDCIGLELVWCDIRFDKKNPDNNGEYSLIENPDTTNGNLKFWFVYKGKPWNIKHD